MTIALIIVVLLVVLLGIAAARPNSFRVERAITINAPPERIFALIDDFNKWSLWSPWDRLDPELKRTYGGAPRGKGASYAWEGNKKVGSGRMEITESSSPSRVVIKLDFLAPFEAHNFAEFVLRPEGNGTNVTWAVYGPNNLMSKVMQMFVSMDRMMGKDFEAGLANLKAAAERQES